MSASEPSAPETSAPEATDVPERERGEKRVRPLIAELRERRARHKQRNPIIRGVYLLASITVILIGVIMLITPGPAFVIIPIGLTLLALEFASAERLLDRALDQADAAKQKARETSPAQRVLAGIATALGIAAAVAAALYWDIPYLPV
ncbi:MAG: PGPGW domain-containing protein [Solirubrobacteraceae bacterium]|nr:PGPGW domain-containing protein [Solirubrobacteraceae bacterium]